MTTTTTPFDAVLWSRLQRFEFDAPGASLSFSKRLARDNGWSHAFALRVIEEYRRFLYLCCAAGHPVTPSDEVDQAWHLHLCYTRSYWEDLCSETLGRPVHHGPTRGGRSEGAKFEDWYERTRASYRAHFGAEPPLDLWPSNAVRFGSQRFERVDRAQQLVIPRRAVRSSVAAFAASLALAGCATSLALSDATTVFVFIALLAVIVVIAEATPAAKSRRKRRRGRGKRRGGKRGGGTGCSATSCGMSDSGCSSGDSGCGGSGCGGGGCGGGGCGGD
ncbi:MAG: hypothetical protein R3F49_14005 [Planctomycetota bacterium]